MSDEEPKSAIEIAMERLRKKDADAGVVDHPLAEPQKQAISEARGVCDAKLAQLEILYKSKVAGLADPDVRQILESEYRRDVQRAIDDRDRKIAKIRT